MPKAIEPTEPACTPPSKGYNSVALPHKFKITVGGCPNNCVKPDPNDLGIISARAPRDPSTK